MPRAIGRDEGKGYNMTAQVQEDKFAGAREQAQAQFESIREMVQCLETAEVQDREGGADETYAPRERIQEDALSVEVRSGWYVPGRSDIGEGKPEEYCILLCTGGPAVRIVGELSEHCEPETARLEMQDWFSPWTEYRPLITLRGETACDPDAQDVLLAYARCFWYGE